MLELLQLQVCVRNGLLLRLDRRLKILQLVVVSR
jgi:hypothetical protein